MFLSPLKPPTKDSVSAEAINASLYYLHVATPEDDHLLQEVEEEQEEETKLYKEIFGEEPDFGSEQQELARLNNVRRKPVPGEDNGTEAQTDQDGEEQQQQQQQPQTEEKSRENTPSLQPTPEQRPQVFPPTPPPFPESEPSVDEDRKENAPGQHVQFLERRPTRSRLPRRPLPPVPDVESSLESVEGGHPAKKPNRWSAMAGYVSNRGLDNWKERLEGLSTRHSFDAHRPQLRPSGHESPSPSARSPRQSQSPSRQSHDSRSPDAKSGFHITLIRRDPTHGTQWNVATLSTSRLDDGGIDIDVSTPGYNRFIAKDEPLSLKNLGLNIQTEGAAAPSLAAIQALQESAGQLMNANESGNNNKPEPPGPRRFRRKLSVSRPYQDDARGSTDQPGGVRASMDGMGPGGLSTSKTQALSKLKSGYYSFTSPWNGTCTFSTSVNGRSLKCKHMIPMPVPPGGAMENTPNPAVTVAEIRFNTPFQPGHLHHQPNPYHLSPFALSQTPTFPTEVLDPALSSTTPNAGSTTNPLTGATTTTTTTNPTSKRATFAALLKQNALTNRPRSHSHTSNPSAAPQPAPTPTPTSTSTHSAVNTTINLGPGLGNLTRKPSTNSTSSTTTVPAPAPAPAPAQGPAQAQTQVHDDPDRLDFTLARERAGGGMRGKSAKLGKLVVEDEGIKMLDLVVAACMGVWWRGYYY